MDIEWSFHAFLWAIVFAGTLVWAGVWSAIALRAIRQAVRGVREGTAWWRSAGWRFGALAALALLVLTLEWLTAYYGLATHD